MRIAKVYADALLPSPFCLPSHLPIQLLLNRNAVRLFAAFVSASPGEVLRVSLPAAYAASTSLRPPDPPAADARMSYMYI